MGQYYFAVVIRAGHTGKAPQVEFVDGSPTTKQMEQAWIGSSMVSLVEGLLQPGGRWHKASLVWAGDYGGNEGDADKNLYRICSDGGDGVTRITELSPEERKLNSEHEGSDPPCFFVNHTQKTYVDESKLEAEPKGAMCPGSTIHPLPLLTAETQSGGGGDFRGTGAAMEIWARDVISVERVAPGADYTEICGVFHE